MKRTRDTKDTKDTKENAPEGLGQARLRGME